MSISVCIITLNEEKVLERLLLCVKKFADEIIVVDTGSSDKTVEIALKYTDKVYFYKWIDDFSSARNFAFSFAESTYLMWLDADDYIDDKNVEKIIKLKENLQKDTYMFKYLCGVDEKNRSSFWFYRERLIKNCEKAKFKGFVHETITPFGQIEYLDIEIEHRKVAVNDNKRNLNIYKKHIKNGEILSARDEYYYAKEYYYLGYLKTAKKLLKKFTKRRDAYSFDLIDAYYTLYDIAIKTNENSPLSYLFLCLQKCGTNGELLCKIGDAYLKNGEILKAIDYYKFSLSCKKPIVGFIKKEYYYIYPLLQLTCLCYKVGDYAQAKYFHQKCEEEDRENPVVIYNRRFFENKNEKAD